MNKKKTKQKTLKKQQHKKCKYERRNKATP